MGFWKTKRDPAPLNIPDGAELVGVKWQVRDIADECPDAEELMEALRQSQKKDERIADLERQLAEAHRRLDWVVDNQGEGGLFDMSRPYVCIRFPVLGRGKERFWCEPKGERLLAAIDREGSEG